MEAKEFVTQIKAHNQAINDIRESSKKLTADYISEHKKFNDDEKVRIVYANGRIDDAYILNVDVHSDGEIFYRFLKPKKDGSKSTIRYRTSYFDKFEIQKG